MKPYHDAPNNKKNTVPGHGYFAKLASFGKEHQQKGRELYMEYRKMLCQEKNGELCEYCRATDFVSPSSATPTPRPYPADYSKLPDFHYLPATGRKPDDYQPRAQIKQMFQEGTLKALKADDKNPIKDFSERCIVSEKLVADYIDHLSGIGLRKDKRRTDLDNDRKRTVRKQQEYNDNDWEDLYHKNQLSTLRVGELQLHINHHNILSKGKKDEKVMVVKAQIGSTVFHFNCMCRKNKTNISLASDSNPESHSDRVEGVVGSCSNSSELNDSGDQAADRQQLEQGTIPESSTSRYGRKRTRVLREKLCAME